MSQTELNPTNTKLPRKLTRLFVLKWSLFVVVISFVIHRGCELWNSDQLNSVTLHFGWLAAAAGAYIVGWLPSVWFWNRTLAAVGNDARMLDTASAYYCGHLGKYIPGKLLVLIIRASMMKRCGCRAGLSIVTAVYETLAMMAVGLAVGIALSPILLTESSWASLPAWVSWMQDYAWVPPLAVVVLGAVSLPTISRIFRGLALRTMPPDWERPNSVPDIRLDTRLLLSGLLAFTLAWSCHGLSLGLTLRGISGTPLEISDWPIWIGAVSLAVGIGFFVIFAPAGLGPRDLILMEVLSSQPSITGDQAVAATVLLRLVWLLAEIAAAGALYYLVKPQSKLPVNESPAS